jgi:signal transduction histidine kinase
VEDPRRTAARAPAARLRGIEAIDLFRRASAYVGFGPEDSRLLAAFHRDVEPQLDAIVEDFYARIEGSPDALKVFTGGAAQIARLKGVLRAWLVRFLEGPQDDEFALLQARIGRTHVAVGLDQWYMVGGLNVFREHLNRILYATHAGRPEHAAATQRAFVKLLDITLALMLETFREDYLRAVLEAEQNATLKRLAMIGEVAASLAHEIRNPLAGISGAIQVLRDTPLREDRPDILEAVLEEVRRLDGRVNDLLLYARPTTIRRAPVEVGDLLRSTIQMLASDPQMGTVEVEMGSDGPGPVFPLDADAVRQVLVNLVLNAAQALEGQGRIRIEVRHANGGPLEIAVEDSGPGVPPGLAGEIFRPFFTTRRGGTGLGLAISRKIAESHGGTLEVEAGSGGGARFVLTLPLPG